MQTYLIIAALLVAAELLYFRIADRFNIIDKPNARSSHSSIVLRGGGIIFLIGVWVWSAFFGFRYPLMLAAVTLAAGISFVDDVRSLPDSVRLMAQFLAMGMLILQLFLCGRQQGFLTDSNLLMTIVFIVLALIVCVGATNIYNFMDGINGITGGYSFAVLVPLMLVNLRLRRESGAEFIDHSLLNVVALALLVFCDLRPNEDCGGPIMGDDGTVIAEGMRANVFERARVRLCPREGKYGVQIPPGAWHTVEVHEPSTIFEAKDGRYKG